MRKYSFLGLYRKFSEADIFEVMRLKKMARDMKKIRQFEIEIFNATFYGKTIFDMFYQD